MEKTVKKTLRLFFLIVILPLAIASIAVLIMYFVTYRQSAPSFSSDENTPSLSGTIQEAAKTPPRITPHPGRITIQNLYDKSEKVVSARELSTFDQFAFFKNGVGTDDPYEADEIVPIIRREVLPLDANGNGTSLETAVTIMLREYGGRGLLRERTVNAITRTDTEAPVVIP